LSLKLIGGIWLYQFQGPHFLIKFVILFYTIFLLSHHSFKFSFTIQEEAAAISKFDGAEFRRLYHFFLYLSFTPQLISLNAQSISFALSEY
jgi:hypothetical protein